MRIWLFAALIAALGLGHQDARRGADTPADPRAFEPPADGRLTDEQVRMYISVQRAASAPSDEPPPSAAPERVIERAAGRAGRELSAARRLAVDLDEYRWVRARIAEAIPVSQSSESPLLTEIDKQVRGNRAKVLGQAETPDDARAIATVTPEAVAYNREFLKKFRDQLDAVSARSR